MQIIKRPFFIKLGRFEVYAEAWQHLKGEPLIQHQKSVSPFATEHQWWMPGLHLIVSRCHPVSSSVEV
ncbi:MAG: hypothetical protein KGL40_00750 [Rhodocyclaceae bacterium]|nr:hypothetical protein [Rhodocyclaceae bacterium]